MKEKKSACIITIIAYLSRTLAFHQTIVNQCCGIDDPKSVLFTPLVNCITIVPNNLYDDWLAYCNT